MLFNEKLQRARFAWLEARDKHAGAQQLHHLLSGTGKMATELHQMSQQLLDTLAKEKQKAWLDFKEADGENFQLLAQARNSTHRMVAAQA